MAVYAIRFAAPAARDLGKLPRAAQEQIRERIDGLAKNPRPPGVVSLQGKQKGLLRIRSGNYRVVYCVEDRYCASGAATAAAAFATAGAAA